MFYASFSLWAILCLILLIGSLFSVLLVPNYGVIVVPGFGAGADAGFESALGLSPFGASF